MNPYWIVAIAAASNILSAIAAWAFLSFGQARINSVFVEQVAQNHLPHIHECLKLIAKKQGIELPEPPPIQFVQLKGK